jgi:hypothetical protein
MSTKAWPKRLFVVEGDFINEGKQHLAGTSLHFKVGKEHGPHTTKNGCKLLVLWTDGTAKAAADLSDFIITKKAAKGTRTLTGASRISMPQLLPSRLQAARNQAWLTMTMRPGLADNADQ